MAKNLVIVESPAKAKTIEGYLGKDFEVKSSFGHIRDLAKDDTAVNIEKGFVPHYEVPSDKKEAVKNLKQLASKAEQVWLATDEDREGEAISWHLAEVLGLDIDKTPRIVFHEITKPAILNAIQNPRFIDMNLVNAQQARRILDRLVGFELSPVLWKKIKPGLSAGRVQSVAVRLIVEREREINQFETGYTYKIQARFDLTGGKILLAESPVKFKNAESARSFIEKCNGAQFTIENLETKPSRRSPAPPFTTSTLQQEASRKLGFSVSQTMVVAQKLYENGFITYMRTDSVNLAESAIEAARKEINKLYGKDYSYTRRFTNKNNNAQEAHEAIRPTYFEKQEIEGDSAARKLYALIWKRTVASQMSEAQFEKTVATIGISTTPEKLTATGEVLKFDGFLKVYTESQDEENEEEKSGMLPPISVGEKLMLESMTATQKFERPPARYTEASLVKKLEENGIGRPSTYAPTISTIVKRGYVVKEDREGKQREFEILLLKNGKIISELKTENYGSEKAKLFPSDIGSIVTDFLLKHFDNVLDYKFTAGVEEEFDEIATGKLKWQQMLSKFYTPFHTTVEKTNESAERQKGERELGIDPVTGKKVIARIGRYGPLIQMGGHDDEKPRFANLKPGQMLESISLEDALDLFKLPRIGGTFEGKEIKIATGRFGPYIQHNSKFISIPRTDNPMLIGEERAIEIILAKRKAESEKLIKSFTENPEVQILKGRWGPYISVGKNNYKIPKGTNPTDLTLEDCLTLEKEQKKVDTGDNKSKKTVAAASDKKTGAKKATTKPKKKSTSTKKK